MACAILGLWAVAVPAAIAFVPDADYTFDMFIQDYSPDYVSDGNELAKRRAIFDERMKEVLAHNADPRKTWKRGINRFSDLAHAEFKNSGRLGFNRALSRVYASSAKSSTSQGSQIDISDLPASFDWREKNAVTAVKDQGHCGSCWAFATTETVESHAYLQTGLLPVLSPQQLVSCAPNPDQCGGVGGCRGSIPEVAFDWLTRNNMTSEWAMPYQSYFGDEPKCNASQAQRIQVVSISGHEKLPPNNYAAVMQALVNKGPLAINVQANTWSDYHGGVFDGCTNYSNIEIDHVVQLVGYGTDASGGDYWLVRNSWDTTWGEAGYIRLKRSSTPQCGDDIVPLDGTGCKGGPSKQWVCGTCGLLFDVSYPTGVTIPHRGHHTVVV